jgi:hypothetical protein
VTAREQLIAYLATLAALVLIVCAALFAAGHGVSITEAFGLGAVTGGLIGVLRIPSAQQPRATASTESGDVNVTPETKP